MTQSNDRMDDLNLELIEDKVCAEQVVISQMIEWMI
jgi:hypothetical protein